jgi:hypothetical protein
LANRAYVDMAYAAFSLLAARLAWAAKRDLDWLLAGCFLGFSADIKYLGLFVIAATILTLILLARSHPAGCVGVRQLGLLSIASAVVGCVWYMRNWLVTGAPIYPMPTGLHWPNRYLSAVDVLRIESYMHARGAAFGHGLKALLLLPFQFTYATHAFQGGGGIGVLPLALAPLLLAKRLREPLVRYWLVWSTVLTGIWFFTDPEARFLIPMITVWAVFASLAAGDLLRRREWLLRGPALAAVLVSLAYGMGAVAWFGGARSPRLRSLTSMSAERAWLHRSVPFAASMDCLNRPDHPGGRVAILRGIDIVTYFLRRDYVLLRGPYGEQPLGPLRLDQLLQQAPALHVTEVLDTRSDFGPFQLDSTPPGWHLECQSSDARVYRAPAVDPWLAAPTSR